MTLDNIRVGQKCRILGLPGRGVRTKAIRFGITEGSLITCTGIIPGGPIIIAKNRQEIAIGRGMAQKIIIELVASVRRNNYGLPRS